MLGDGKGVSPKEWGALGVGLSVTIASALITSLVNPIPFPFNFLISFALGGTAGFGALKVLDPDTDHDRLEKQTNAEYQHILQQILDITRHLADCSASPCISPEISERLGNIARMAGMILTRFQDRPREFAWASSTNLLLRRMDEILVGYLKVKCGERFLDETDKEEEIVENENHVIPMIEMALRNLGKKLDAGEARSRGVAEGTLESMLRSLNLIESLTDQLDSSPPTKGFPND